MAMTCEELYIKNIENAIRAIRLGVKKPSEVNPASAFEKLLPLNDGIHSDLLTKYQHVVNDFNRKLNQRNEAKQ